MQHADEGILHSYLDGELTPAEVVELERHLSVCAPCRAKLAEARGFLGVADELIPLLDVAPAGTKAPATAPKPRRTWRLRPAAVAWAASVLLAAGIGYAWHARPSIVGSPEALPQLSDASNRVTPAVPPPAQPQDEPAATTHPPAVARRDAPAAQAHDALSPTPLAAAPTDPPPAPIRQEAEASAAGAAAPSAGLASKSTGEVRANDNIAMLQGVPVDTTAVRQRLAFGPATTPEPKRITLDQAVDLLGGSIQLIDGLTPQRVEVLAGVDVVGADPSRQVVRVYYEEPDLGLVTLDQQRPGPSFDARRPESPTAMPPVSVAPSAPAPASAYRRLPEPNTMTWRADGVWLSLTTRLSNERMALLQARVK